MKTSFVSSLALTTAMRNSISGVQRELNQANQEALTGAYADKGFALGAQTARTLDLTRDISRIESLHATASLATQRLESAELSLSKMSELGLEIRNSIMTLGGSADAKSLDTAQTTVRSALESFTNFANTAVNGEYIFSGINTDVKPLDDFLAPGSPAKAAFDRELTFFLNGAAKADMTETDMKAFLDNVSAKFNGTTKVTSPPHPAQYDNTDFWTSFVSSASDENMKSRISQTEVVESSTNSNSSGMRNFALASLVSMEFMKPEMSDAARTVAVTKTTQYISEAISGVDAQRTTVGIYTERVSKAEERLQAQKDILAIHLGDLQNIDQAEAATRVNTLKTLLETAYTVTAKIQQLSLVNYL